MAPHIRPWSTVESALRDSDAGLGDAANAAKHGVAIKTIRRWRREYQRLGRPRGQTHTVAPCPRCEDGLLDGAAYAELLGWYLGDGHLSRGRRDVYNLHVVNDRRYVLDNERLKVLMASVKKGGRPHTRLVPGAVVTTVSWKHWPCLFPQHGPGRKHDRPIVLDDWQREVVETHPAAFLRGLFHSDGSRVRNWATRPVAGVLKRYDYPRWQFSNVSADIRELCCCPSSCLAGLPAEARGARRLREPVPTGAERRVVRLVSKPLDLVDVARRQSNWNMVSVSRRDAVSRLDELIGPKR